MPPEAQTREPDPALGGHAVDQAARAVDPNLTVEVIPTADEVVEDLRAQMAELDKRDKEKDIEIEASRRRASDAERARIEAENRARDADRQAREATANAGRSVEAAQLDAIKNSLSTHQGHMTNLKGQLAAANAEGDFAKAADLQGEMSIVGGRIAQLESGANELEIRVKNPPTDQGRQVDQSQELSPAQRKENYINGQPPRIQDWLRSDKGQRFFTDPDFAAKVGAAASYAQTVKGIAISSQEYIDFVEEQVGLRAPSVADPPPRRDDRAPSAPGQGRTPDAGQRMTAAPAGGASDGSVRRNAGGTIEVYLTQDERDMAKRMGVSDTDWAKNKRDLMQEGQIGPGARNR